MVLVVGHESLSMYSDPGDLLECKRKAKNLISSADPPRNTTGRKKGYIEVMADIWKDKGYGYLGLKSQNLRDQASRLEKMEREQNYTRNTSTLLESGNRLEEWSCLPQRIGNISHL